MSEKSLEEISGNIWFARNQLACLADELTATKKQHETIKNILSRLWEEYQKLRIIDVPTKQD